ncbi:hypothetical protein BDW42DRAFT_154831 [Aspergillus taichungensis]|uniref:Uncharacterized protein n=1 Tax=Aspergillus taichungensis TaxID=482145 RepID=A0A2J5HL23_9EURO|nr:hypothetical protein BDW42DRAFT_154831 [Aspergillus taichungensis]
MSISSPNSRLSTNPESPFSRGGRAKSTEIDEVDLNRRDTPMRSASEAAAHYMRSSSDAQLGIMTQRANLHGVRDQVDDDEGSSQPGIPIWRGPSDLTAHVQQHSDNRFASNRGGIHPTIAVPVNPERQSRQQEQEGTPSLPLRTAVEPASDWSQHATPRAQTKHELEEYGPTSRPSNHDGVSEGSDTKRTHQTLDDSSDVVSFDPAHANDGEAEIHALKSALAECWSLCNTLASLSHIHQRSTECSSSISEPWKSCWRLCQELYAYQGWDFPSQIDPTLDTCRDFCQTLFEARARDDELVDSVLRVSFELNNHLYNTRDRNLPDVFRERTLEFYITLCHRLMKQRMRSSRTEFLLSACWSLAEILFNMRQNFKERRRLDEDLVGAAVQACWELCDIFRQGWTQRSLRSPDRGTPPMSQAIFTSMIPHTEQDELDSVDKQNDRFVQNPETPTTIFEDIATISSEEAPIQNIFILGQSRNKDTHTTWSSNSSSISDQTQSSEQTSSTNTVTKTPIQLSPTCRSW